MGITYNIRQTGGVTVVDLGGRIVLGESMASRLGSGLTLHGFIRDVLKAGHKNILLNLRDISHVDSMGIGELSSCLITVRSQGGELKVTNPNERVRSVLNLTHLNTVLDVVDGEAAAIQSFARAAGA